MPKADKIAQRRSMAFRMRKEGLSFGEIARRLRKSDLAGPRYSKTQAGRDVKHVLDNADQEDAKQLRTLMTAQLFDLWAIWLPLALAGNVDGLRSCNAILDRLIRMYGIEYLGRFEQDPIVRAKLAGDLPMADEVSIRITIPENFRVRADQLGDPVVADYKSKLDVAGNGRAP